MKKFAALFLTLALACTMNVAAFAATSSPSNGVINITGTETETNADVDLIVTPDSQEDTLDEEYQAPMDEMINDVAPEEAAKVGGEVTAIFDVHYTNGQSGAVTFTVPASLTGLSKGDSYEVIHLVNGQVIYEENTTLNDDGSLTISVDSLSPFGIIKLSSASGSGDAGDSDASADSSKSNSATTGKSPKTGETTSTAAVVACILFAGVAIAFASKSRKHA